MSNQAFAAALVYWRRANQSPHVPARGSTMACAELSWDVLCPTCGGVLDITTSLRMSTGTVRMRTVQQIARLDEMVGCILRQSTHAQIAAHDPQTLPFWDWQMCRFHDTTCPMKGSKWSRFTLDARVPRLERTASVLVQVPGWVIVSCSIRCRTSGTT